MSRTWPNFPVDSLLLFQVGGRLDGTRTPHSMPMLLTAASPPIITPPVRGCCRCLHVTLTGHWNSLVPKRAWPTSFRHVVQPACPATTGGLWLGEGRGFFFFVVSVDEDVTRGRKDVGAALRERNDFFLKLSFTGEKQRNRL